MTSHFMNYLEKCLLSKRELPPRLSPLLVVEEVRVLRSKTCPWCGRRFKGLKYLKSHYRRRQWCSAQYKAFMRELVRTYRGFRNSLQTRKTRNGERIYRLRIADLTLEYTDYTLAFKTYTAAAGGDKR
jgi:hypothetical protein